jgi:murein DD-endopeptidase MepM/ murein hydrolase activator NlpD
VKRALVIAVLVASAACGRDEPATTPQVARDIYLGPDGQSIDAVVPRNATLETLLRQHDLPSDTMGSLMQAVASVFNPKSLRANQQYRITRTLDGLFREFQYQIDADRLLRVVATRALNAPGAAPAFTAEVIELPKTFELTAIAIEIEKGGSLIGALEARGENVQLALETAKIFEGDVDFNSDLQPGDRLELLFERAVRDGQFAGYGEIKAAIMDNDGRHLTAIGSKDAAGTLEWHDAEGKSLKRQFLKSPLFFDPRITSRFSNSRLHPVHGTYRAHLGVDFGAPYGTAVRTVANGSVEFAAYSGEAGRMIRIRHAGGYQTAYLHLSSFASGVRVGARVSQGQVIGFVGATGTATGPHLDYRIMRNGRYVDPIAEHKRMPKGETILPAQLPAFLTLRDEALGRITTLLAAQPPSAAASPKPPQR